MTEAEMAGSSEQARVAGEAGVPCRRAALTLLLLALPLALVTAGLPQTGSRRLPVLLSIAPLTEVPVEKQIGEVQNFRRLASAGSTSSHNRFCGLAITRNRNNNYDSSSLGAAAAAVGAQRLWYYNWRATANTHVPGVEFVPMISKPGQAGSLPYAGRNGVGRVVLGWNEPDDRGQAGKNVDLFSNPWRYAAVWTRDMQIARSKGYTEFVSPAMAHDACWLDHFLKSCASVPGCRDLVTYLGMHRYRSDCATYQATMGYMGWREDLGYILTFNKIREKYNRMGFHIKGLWWSEFGCLAQNFVDFAPAWQSARYLDLWYRDTLVKVLNNDGGVIAKITARTPDSNWLGADGPDAHEGGNYWPGQCRWQAPAPGSNPGADAVRAIQSLSRMAWFSIGPETNYLFDAGGGHGLNGLGRHYFDACRAVR